MLLTGTITLHYVGVNIVRQPAQEQPPATTGSKSASGRRSTKGWGGNRFSPFRTKRTTSPNLGQKNGPGGSRERRHFLEAIP